MDFHAWSAKFKILIYLRVADTSSLAPQPAGKKKSFEKAAAMLGQVTIEIIWKESVSFLKEMENRQQESWKNNNRNTIDVKNNRHW